MTDLGGMFCVVKARRDQTPDDRDPGWQEPPAGRTAYAWTREPPPAASHAAHTSSNDFTVHAKKPSGAGMRMEH